MTSATFSRMHVSLYVTDLAKTVEFYTSFFGQEPDKVKPSYAKFMLSKPALIISFVENPARVQQNFGHLGFQVETLNELRKYLEDVKAKGLVNREEIGTACCYAVQDKFWVEDPDGVQWEVYYFHEDAAFNDPHFEEQDASACCMPSEQPQQQKLQLTNISYMPVESTSCTPGSGCC
ncbi:ArsI/CadI family heavy metal resistance metalloenzyme [Pontibacter oryzae]|uniref:Glyoxalase/bleomycin resistance/dioxygenase family protein n=1 Tax=Pontibacter oryzae TaxID=2304593 RepID=A0A399SH55_9BACT|nr:ArsI/CadI family heavy metal resistance metalloenzyme [Pontibacter oryzae]RIJ41873.1 glyoxalase/bleomycin resistance/dioxygenase family protein [Pontibacter oryzae]